MSDTGKIAINRHLVGAIALVCLGGWAGLALLGSNLDEAIQQGLRGALMRVGLVMSAFWLALPRKGREAAWANVTPLTLIGLIAAVLAIAWRPRAVLPVLIVLAAIGYVLRPRRKPRPDVHASRR